MITLAKAEAAVYLLNRCRADAYRTRDGSLCICTEEARRSRIVALLGQPDSKRYMPVSAMGMPSRRRRPMILIYRVRDPRNRP